MHGSLLVIAHHALDPEERADAHASRHGTNAVQAAKPALTPQLSVRVPAAPFDSLDEKKGAEAPRVGARV